MVRHSLNYFRTFQLLSGVKREGGGGGGGGWVPITNRAPIF